MPNAVTLYICPSVSTYCSTMTQKAKFRGETRKRRTMRMAGKDEGEDKRRRKMGSFNDTDDNEVEA